MREKLTYALLLAVKALSRVFYLHERRNVVPISRERYVTFSNFLIRVQENETMAVILPEGRMKRRTGLDAHGEALTVRGGIADLLRAIPQGRMAEGGPSGFKAAAKADLTRRRDAHFPVRPETDGGMENARRSPA